MERWLFNLSAVSLEVPVGKHPQPASEKWFRWYNDPKKARKNNIAQKTSQLVFLLFGGYLKTSTTHRYFSTARFACRWAVFLSTKATQQDR